MRAGHAPSMAWLGIAIAAAYGLSRPGNASEPFTVRARDVTAIGVSIAIASAATHRHHGLAVVLRNLATAAASLVAIEALGRIEGGTGLAPSATLATFPRWARPQKLARIAQIASAFVWLAGIVPGETSSSDEERVHNAWNSASISGVSVLVLTALIALVLGFVRRLELAARVRTLACAGLPFLAMGLLPLLATRLELGDATMILLSLASAILVRLARQDDALRLAHRSRRALTLVVFGGPVVGLAALAGDGHAIGGLGGASAVIMWSLAALLVGGAASMLEEVFLPERGLLLGALARARDAAVSQDFREAMAQSLEHVRRVCSIGLGPTVTPSPELWLFDPARVLSVDAAGYLREHTGELPTGLVDLALAEPHKTVRTSVLRALEVKRPDLRPMLAWLEQRNALFATVIAATSEPEGLLVVPRGARESDVSLDELRSAEQLANVFVAAVQASSATERHLDRERGLQRRLQQHEDTLRGVRHASRLDAERVTRITERLGRTASTGLYSPASRMAFEALERRLEQASPCFLHAPYGVDAAPFVARAHVLGPKRSRPFVIVDGTSTEEHDAARWTDPTQSPLALAGDGLLCVLDCAALPLNVQTILARALAHQRAPWDRTLELRLQLVVTAARSVESLVAEGQLAPQLAEQFANGEPIMLPRLRDRPEDLRSILADRLAREGLRVRGRPVGIEPAAYAKLIEHSFDGEDAELAAIVTRLVAKLEGDVVRERDVAALGLATQEASCARR